MDKGSSTLITLKKAVVSCTNRLAKITKSCFIYISQFHLKAAKKMSTVIFNFALRQIQLLEKVIF